MYKKNLAYQIILSVLLLLLYVFIGRPLHAQTITGTFSHGSSMTISSGSGVNFLTKSVAQPVVWDDMSSGKFNSNWSATNALTVSSTVHRPQSSYAGYCNMNSEKWCNFEGGSDASTWFYQYWIYLGANFTFSGDMNNSLGNIKIFRMWDTGSDANNCVASLHYAGEMGFGCEYTDTNHNWGPTVSGSGCNWISCLFGRSDPGYVDPSYTGWKSFPTDITTQAWHLFQFEFKDSSTTGSADGVMRMWFDGKKILDRADVVTTGSGNTHNKRPKVVGWYNSHSTNGSNADFYIADAYIDNTWARVEAGDNNVYDKCSFREIQIPTAWAANSISFRVNKGKFQSGQPAYIFVTDANGNRYNLGQVTVGGGGVSTDNPPSVAFTSPTSGGTFGATGITSIALAGTASDDKGVSSVTWNSDRGGSGTASYASGAWSASSVPVKVGQNVVTVTATDTAGQTSVATLTIINSKVSWDANVQTGDSIWKDSGVTRTVRLLVQGTDITAPASKVYLGFQGRTTGGYTISKVSIAERDPSTEGNVVASTWSKITFDASDVANWDTDVITVPAGSEKLSDIIPIKFDSAKDYYVTFRINSASVYLDPPTAYKELYFDTADHTSDIQWNGLGYLSTQDYHALATVYYAGPLYPTLTIAGQ